MDSPLTLSFESPHRAILTITGALSQERLPALQASITAAQSAIKEAAQKAGGPIDILLDMAAFDGTYDVEAMDGFTEFAKNNSEYVRKTAGFTTADKANIAGEMVAALAGRDNIKFFASKEEALAWLEA